jgi:hypothetical protein
MSEKNDGPTFEGLYPPVMFRECVELAKMAQTPEKRGLYLKMAGVWHQMATRWEKKSS